MMIERIDVNHMWFIYNTNDEDDYTGMVVPCMQWLFHILLDAGKLSLLIITNTYQHN